MPSYQQNTIRNLACALGISKSTLFTMKSDREKDTVILPVSIAAQPLLTEEHKSQRVFYCCENVNFVDSTFNDCFSSIHIDEKWFFISEKQLRMYITPDEESPRRYLQNKDHILKVMFLCAVARPRFDDQNGECLFDGKIGMWPFVEHTRA